MGTLSEKESAEKSRGFPPLTVGIGTPLDEETPERYAVIRNALRQSGTPIPTNDMWISATAMQHGLIVVTTDPLYTRVKQILVEYLPAE